MSRGRVFPLHRSGFGRILLIFVVLVYFSVVFDFISGQIVLDPEIRFKILCNGVGNSMYSYELCFYQLLYFLPQCVQSLFKEEVKVDCCVCGYEGDVTFCKPFIEQFRE